MKTKNPKGGAATKSDKPTMIVFLLDRSGSMASCRAETVNGFNSYLKELQTIKDDSRITLRQFDAPHGVETVYENEPIENVKPMAFEFFQPRGGTPLYDAMGTTITTVAEQARDKFKVLFVVLTDGEENQSQVWTYHRVHELIKEREAKDHWTFVYIGMGAEGFRQMENLAQGTQSISNVVQTDTANAHVMYAAAAQGSNCYRMSTNSGNSVVTQFWQADENADKKGLK